MPGVLVEISRIRMRSGTSLSKQTSNGPRAKQPRFRSGAASIRRSLGWMRSQLAPPLSKHHRMPIAAGGRTQHARLPPPPPQYSTPCCCPSSTAHQSVMLGKTAVRPPPPPTAWPSAPARRAAAPSAMAAGAAAVDAPAPCPPAGSVRRLSSGSARGAPPPRCARNCRSVPWGSRRHGRSPGRAASCKNMCGSFGLDVRLVGRHGQLLRTLRRVGDFSPGPLLRRGEKSPTRRSV